MLSTEGEQRLRFALSLIRQPRWRFMKQRVVSSLAEI
jgi:hypothetical protein